MKNFSKLNIDDLNLYKYENIIFILSSLLLFALIFERYFILSPIQNEFETIVDARHFVKPYWIDNDFFLNSNQFHRMFFNSIFGPLIDKYWFMKGILISRIIIFLILSFSLTFLLKTYNVHFSLSIIVVYLFLNSQSIVAGEWIVGGVETKTLAYSMLFVSIAFFTKRKYLLAFFFSGLSMSFHLLVGTFSLFCIVFSVLINYRLYKIDIVKILKNSCILLVTGLPVIITVLYHILFTFNDNNISVDNISSAWNIYVKFRNPHHLYPDFWGREWVLEILVYLIILVTVYTLTESKKLRFLTGFTIGTFILFLIGMMFYYFNYTSLLRFYWFRVPDSLILLMINIVIAIIISDILRLTHNYEYKNILKEIKIRNKIRILSAVIIIISVTIYFQSIIRLTNKIDNISINKSVEKQINYRNYTKIMPVLTWIKENTDKSSIFLVHPGLNGFSAYSERSMFVSFKKIPINSEEILEWFVRIKLCNNLKAFKHNGFKALNELGGNFNTLDEKIIRFISSKYNISYFLTASNKKYSFPITYSDKKYKLYKIEN